MKKIPKPESGYTSEWHKKGGDSVKEIIVDISSDGEIKIETRGFKGKSCLKESQFLKDLLGNETSKQLTPAYYQEQKVTVKKYLPLCG